MTKDEALNIAIDYMNERLEEHDAKFQRHPVAEAERNNILADIEAVKEALAQTEQEQLMSDQINYGMSVTQGGKRIDPMSIYKEPEQEPMAWVGLNLDNMAEAFHRVIEEHHSRKNPFHDPVNGDAMIALRELRGLIAYMKRNTTPPQRKPLTENEIKHLWYETCQTNLELTSQLIVHLARNIEAAHQIKGEA